MLKAVFWDMDGTLIDSEPYWHAGEMQIAHENGGVWNDELAWNGSGRPVPDVAREIAEHGCTLPVEEIGRRMIEYVTRAEYERIPWIPGTRELLVALRDAGVPSVLVTTSPRNLAENLIAQAPAGAARTTWPRSRIRHRMWRRRADSTYRVPICRSAWRSRTR